MAIRPARVRKQTASGATEYTWDGLNLLLQGGPTGETWYCHGYTPIEGIRSLLAHKVDGGDRRVYHEDHLRSTIDLTDQGGQPVVSHDYWPFGEILSGPGEGLLFCGKEWEQEEG